MPSQYGEHARILEYFGGQTGRFLDVGAFDGVTFSNTRCLANLGWSGVLVEPSPPAFCWLMKNYADLPDIELVNAAIGFATERRLVPFHVNTSDAYSADMLSTLSPAHKALFPRHPWRRIHIPVLTWGELFHALPGPYDFVNIDVEGSNEALLDSFPFQAEWPRLICVELDPADRREAMAERLAREGFSQQEVIGGNLLAWR